MHVFGPTGLLRSSGRTIVLVTHSVHWLPYSDNVIILEEGKILEQGSFKELSQAKDSYVQRLDVKPPPIRASINLSQLAEQAIPKLNGRDVTQNGEGAASNSAVSGSDRKTGNFTTYMYYLSSLGLMHGLFFFITPVARIVLTTFQSMGY